MKKFYLILALLTITIRSNAKIVTVIVSDNQFSPSNAILNVGDTIKWQWESGTHTTTSTSVPANAGAWDAPIDAANTVFSYVVMEPGAYAYQCNFHFQMGMRGLFTAIEHTGINENQPDVFMNVKANSLSDQIYVDLNTAKAGAMNLRLYNILGKEIRNLLSTQQGAGSYHYTYDVGDLARGIYFVKLSMQDVDLVKRIMIQ